MSRRVAAAALAAVAVTALAGCSSSSDGATSTPPPSSAPPVTTPAPTPTTATPTPTPTTSSAAPSTSASSTTTPPTTSPAAPSTTPAPAAPAFTTTCRTLTVRVIPGGAVRGAEIAAIQYTNDGAATCTITGVPSARLLRGGTPVGPASQPSGDPVRPFTLEPGDVGESLLRDFSTCNAPLADGVRVSLPSRAGRSGGTTTGPARLRACEIRLAPVGAPA